MENIRDAQTVMSLFPKSAEFIRSHFKPASCFYLGHVVNSVLPCHPEELLPLKLKSRTLLFIGNRKYLPSARHLLEAFKNLKKELRCTLQLHFVGLTQADFGQTESNVHFHGYLDKNNTQQCELYYQLLFEARMIINTQSSWAAFSALTEGMYYYTPVICTPNDEFTESYGTHCHFGYYVDADNEKELQEAVEKIVMAGNEEFLAMAKNAHQKTLEFTWDNYTNKFLDVVSKKSLQAT